jgi:hypothetical protein
MERLNVNRTIVESARTMLHNKDLPKKLWAEAINTAVYILNRTLVPKGKEVTPFQMWHGKKPNLSLIRTFGIVMYT